MESLTADTLSFEEFSCLIPMVIQAWFSLVPAGQVPELRSEAMAAAMSADLDRMATVGRQSPLKVLTDSRQPAFLQVLVGALLETIDCLPKDMRLEPEATVAMVLALKTLVDELDFALRR